MTVHLIPTDSAFIPGVPAVEGDYEDETAAELLAWSPPAFVVAPIRKPVKGPAQAPSAETPSDSSETEE